MVNKLLIRAARLTPFTHTRFPFRTIKKIGNGMMSSRNYQLLYMYALNAPSGDMLEIGAGHGASTVSIGLGLFDSKRPFTLHTIEKCEGGSRARFGNKATNLQILNNTIMTFSLQNRVVVHDVHLRHGARETILSSLGELRKVGLLFIDADGELARDFDLFFSFLVPDAYVIIDDYQDIMTSGQNYGRTPVTARKFLKTHAYVQFLIGLGILQPREISGNTLFATAPAVGPDVAEQAHKGLDALRLELNQAAEHPAVEL